MSIGGTPPPVGGADRTSEHGPPSGGDARHMWRNPTWKWRDPAGLRGAFEITASRRRASHCSGRAGSICSRSGAAAAAAPRSCSACS